MGRILAIDYGQKRVGLAVTDTQQIIATSLTTVRTCDLWDFLKKYLTTESVDAFVIGFPKQMNNQASESMVYILPFAKKLVQTYPNIPLFPADERFTSKMAVQTMLSAGLKKKDRQNKAEIDAVSACLILQGYMEMRANGLEIKAFIN